jgi:hypothetical protein
MASSKEGFPAGLSGRIGNMVVFQSMGKTIIRSMPTKKRAPAKGAQKKSQEEFARIMKIMQAIKPFIRNGFHDAAEGRTAFHTALSENIRLHRASDAPENLHWLLVSTGERSGATGLMVQRNEKGVKVAWDIKPPGKPASGDDRVMLLALNTTSLAATHNLDAASRQKGEAILPLPPALPGEKTLIFITFRNLMTTEKKSLKNISESQRIELIADN